MKIIVTDWRPVALNEFIGKHWSVGARRKAEDKRIIWAMSAHLPKATKKRRIDLEFILGKNQKARDPDAHWKSVLDALKYCGMLVDDSSKWVEMGNVSYKRGAKGITIITLTDIE